MLVGDDGGDAAVLRFVSQEIEEESSTCAVESVVRQNRLDPHGAVHQLFSWRKHTYRTHFHPYRADTYVCRPTAIRLHALTHKNEPAHMLRSTPYSLIIPSRGTAPQGCQLMPRRPGEGTA